MSASTPLSVVDRTLALVIRALSTGGDAVRLPRNPGEDDENYLARWSAHISDRQAQALYYEETRRNRERTGISLKDKRLEQAQRIVSDCTQAAIATKELAVSAICAERDEANAILTALENQAMWVTRRLDTLAALLGNPGTGCFLDELEPLTEEQATDLERETENG